MSRLAHRLFSSHLRFPTRVNLNIAARSSRAALTRRMMSSGSHASHGGSAPSDTPWLIGSALVFGPVFLYLVSPSARKGSHGHHEHKSHHDDEHEDKHSQHVQSHQDVIPVADDEGTEVSAQEVKDSIERASEVDSPKDAQEREEVVAKAETVVEESSTTEAQPQTESLTDATPAPESELVSSLSAPVKVGEATHVTGDEKARSTL